MGKLEGRVAVVTGGNAGIGLACAKRFAQEGARVFITGRRQAELDAAVAEIGGDARGVAGDVTKFDDLDRLYEIVRGEAGRIDVLLANAGVAEFAAVGDITEQHYDYIFDINVKGVVFTVQKAVPLLVDGASVVLMGSVASIVGNPAFSVYSATKAAIRSFARNWMQDFGPRRIRVNVVAPGVIPTKGSVEFFGGEEKHREISKGMAAQAPLGRLGTEEEVAAAALFLASDDSSYTTGSQIYVDGGRGQY